MDFMLLSALAFLLVASVFISYDIACQFKLGFKAGMPKLPKDLHIPPDVELGWGIPKCHCPMHKVPCQAPHLLNFKPGVGCTDSEGIEWSWAKMNCVVNSTKEMGPRSWQYFPVPPQFLQDWQESCRSPAGILRILPNWQSLAGLGQSSAGFLLN